MTRFFFTPRLATTLLAVLVFAGLTSGCSKRVTTTDAGYTKVEGTPSADSKLATWVDQDLPSYRFADPGTPADFTDDVLIGAESMSGYVAGRLEGQILDGTKATSYDLFTRDANGGFRRLLDYPVLPTLKWTDGQWEAYRFVDSKTTSSGAYVGRGLVNGLTGEGSPLSNVTGDLGHTFDRSLDFAVTRSQADSLLTFAWSSDPNAVGYWVQVFPYGDLAKSQVGEFEANEALPILQRVGPSDNLVAYVPASAPEAAAGAARRYSIKLSPTGVTESSVGAKVITSRGFLGHSFYLVRVIAVDAGGNAINTLKCDYRLVHTNDTYKVGNIDASVYRLVPIGGILTGSGIELGGFFRFNLKPY